MPGNTKPKNTQFHWFEIFRAGTHTDSKGQSAEFTAADLQSVVSNFKPKTAPLVIGHPEQNDPAWGWAAELKIEGDKLFARADDVDHEFAQAVENRRYPNRSVRLVKTANGYELGHIGFLGAKPPAVGGMQWQFNAAEAEAVSFEFALEDQINSLTLDTSHAVVRIFRKLKSFFTERHGAEEADRMLPDWEIDSLAGQAAVVGEDLYRQRLEQQQSEFSQQLSQKDVELKATQDQLAALQLEKLQLDQQKQQLAFSAALSDAQQFVAELNSGAAPRFTKTDGLADFLAHLSAQDVTFDFAAPDGSAQTSTQAQWLKDFLKSIPEQTVLTQPFDKTAPAVLSANDLAKLASDYQQNQHGQGVVISLSSAIEHVKQQHKVINTR
jgi:hypothetical protein